MEGLVCVIMAEEEGFEPPRGVNPLAVFKTAPFSQTWVLLRAMYNVSCPTKIIVARTHTQMQHFYLVFFKILLYLRVRMSIVTPDLQRFNHAFER